MMNVLKHPSFFRPMSRPSSPAPMSTSSPTTTPTRPDSIVALDRAPRPLNKLSLSNFRRPTPAQSAATPAPLIQDGSYLEVLSLKLSEAVTKVLAQPTGPAAANEQVSGRRPIPQGRGHALGALIASELKAAQDSPHLQRAILRSLHRPLSVLLNNLSARLLPLISSTAFKLPPAPTVQAPNPNPTQLHALAIATFAGELLETFDQFDLGIDSDLRGDGLKVVREGLTSLINRVIGPLVAGIRDDLMPLLEALETPSSVPTKVASSTKANGGHGINHHPSIVTLQAMMPIYARALARYTTSTVSQTILATFLISVVWRGLVALAHRPYVPPSPPASPSLLPLTIKKSSGSTPPLTPPAGRFSIKLPPSRPPSPPAVFVPATAASDARALYDLFSILPCPPKDKEATRLAREVVDDALEGLKALPPLLDAVHALASKQANTAVELAQELELLATEVPLLIALPVLLHAHGQGKTTTISVAHILGLSEEEYRKECLFGFGRAEECAAPVALRVMDALLANPEANPVVCKWLEMEIAEALGQ